ncbi:rhodopsin-like [Oculina patagonica]
MSSLNEGEFVALGAAMTVLMIIGFALQAISLFILLKPPFRKFDLSPYFLNVALSNTIVIAVDFPAIAASAWAQKTLLGDLHCQMLGFFTGVGCITTFATMALALVKIYRRLSEENVEFETVLAERETWDRHKIIKTLTVTWLYAIAVMFPPMVGWGSFAFESGGAICAPNWRENTDSGRAYLLVLVILAFVIPLAVSIVCSIRIYRRSKQTCTVSMMTAKDKKKARKAVMMVLVGIGSFVLSWMPYCMCALISVFGGSEMFDREKSFIPGIFAKASTVYNPLICLLVSKRFRTVALNLFGFSYKREQSTAAAFNLGAVVLTQATPCDEELDGKRQTISCKSTPCWPNTPLLQGNALNSRAPKETVV